MGLDQYLIIRKHMNKKQGCILWDPRSTPTEDVLNLIVGPGGVGTSSSPAGKPANTWRKWYELDDYLMSKAPKGSSEVLLGAMDLDMLEAWFRSQDPAYDSDQVCDDYGASAADYYRQHNKQLLKLARRVVSLGDEVVYTSWG